jgi:predicted cupin superfamily sugar epimerase
MIPASSPAMGLSDPWGADLRQLTRLVERLDLRPHPEGGLYRELHRSRDQVLRVSDGEQRSGITVIAYLLQRGERSRWHRVAGSDELWQHGAGAPLDLWCLPLEGGTAERLALGPWDATAGLQDEPLRVIPAGCWQAARSRGAWSLVYCAVGPGFDFADFELLADRPALLHPPGALEDLL